MRSGWSAAASQLVPVHACECASRIAVCSMLMLSYPAISCSAMLSWPMGAARVKRVPSILPRESRAAVRHAHQTQPCKLRTSLKFNLNAFCIESGVTQAMVGRRTVSRRFRVTLNGDVGATEQMQLCGGTHQVHPAHSVQLDDRRAPITAHALNSCPPATSRSRSEFVRAL